MGTDPSNVTCSSSTDDPIQMANWYQAIAFCNKLSLAEGLTPVYSVSGVSDWASLSYDSIPTVQNADWDAVTATWTHNGYRLPTEMEWLWAALGAPADGQSGGTNTTGYAKAFAGSTGSNAIDDYSWNNGNSDSMTHPVGTKSPNELGLYDMSGNVCEMCWDWFSSDGPTSCSFALTGTCIDYRGPSTGTTRVGRGGAWCNIPSDFGFSARWAYGPFRQYKYKGFRVVLP